MYRTLFKVIIIVFVYTQLTACGFFNSTKSNNDTPREWVKNNYETLLLALDMESTLDIYHIHWDKYESWGKSKYKHFKIMKLNLDILADELKQPKQVNPETNKLQITILYLLDKQKKRLSNFSKGYNDPQSTGSIADAIYDAGAFKPGEYSKFEEDAMNLRKELLNEARGE